MPAAALLCFARRAMKGGRPNVFDFVRIVREADDERVMRRGGI
jgi:hypothetical protein